MPGGNWTQWEYSSRFGNTWKDSTFFHAGDGDQFRACGRLHFEPCGRDAGEAPRSGTPHNGEAFYSDYNAESGGEGECAAGLL